MRGVDRPLVSTALPVALGFFAGPDGGGGGARGAGRPGLGVPARGGTLLQGPQTTQSSAGGVKQSYWGWRIAGQGQEEGRVQPTQRETRYHGKDKQKGEPWADPPPSYTLQELHAQTQSGLLLFLSPANIQRGANNTRHSVNLRSYFTFIRSLATNVWFPNLWSSAGFVSTCSTSNLSPWFLCVLGYFHLESRVREKSVTLFLSVFLYESCRSIIISNREVKSQILCWITWDNVSVITHRNLKTL